MSCQNQCSNLFCPCSFLLRFWASLLLCNVSTPMDSRKIMHFVFVCFLLHPTIGNITLCISLHLSMKTQGGLNPRNKVAGSGAGMKRECSTSIRQWQKQRCFTSSESLYNLKCHQYQRQKQMDLSFRDQALSLWSGSTDPKTLDYQRTNCREYQIVRTKETT